jgi:hypothetical protein
MKISGSFIAAPNTGRFFRGTSDLDDESASVRRYHGVSDAHMGRRARPLPFRHIKNLYRGPDTKETRPEVGR